ncbi:MAG TPA: hypothetical protein DCR46_06480 [Cytophagales bacterium]|nr:hypothetical protein [Cytophagales bacterium]
MTFRDYCTEKKIDADKFFVGDLNLYTEWENCFGQMSPESFTQNKKFLINTLRMRYPTLKK